MELEVTWGRAVKVWWAHLWRNLLMIVAMLIFVTAMGFVVGQVARRRRISAYTARWQRNGVAGVLCGLLIAGAAMAQTEGFEAGSYSLNGRGDHPQLFSVEKVGDKWLVKSSDPDFVMLKVVCVSNCDYLPMPEDRKQKLLPAQLMQSFDMGCIANIGFALCKLTSKPLRECRNAKAGEACRVGPPGVPGKPLYALFSLFAPNVAPVTVTRVGAP